MTCQPARHVQVRYRTAALHRGTSSILLTSLMNYYLIHDCMPGCNLVALLTGTTLFRTACVYLMARIHRSFEIRSREDFAMRFSARHGTPIAA